MSTVPTSTFSPDDVWSPSARSRVTVSVVNSFGETPAHNVTSWPSLKNGAGLLVPIGTFNEGHEVTLWAGVSPKEFTTLTVTRERADGDQTSSGEKVLVGTVDTTS